MAEPCTDRKGFKEVANFAVEGLNQANRELAQYAWEQAKIFGYEGTLEQFLSTHGLAEYGSDITDKAKDTCVNKLTKSGVTGSPWHVDFNTGYKLLANPDTWKIPTKKEEADMKKGVAVLKRSYGAVKAFGFNGS